jgi:hypothetical protein
MEGQGNIIENLWYFIDVMRKDYKESQSDIKNFLKLIAMLTGNWEKA